MEMQRKSNDATADREGAGKKDEGKLFNRFPQRSEWREDEDGGGERLSLAWLLVLHTLTLVQFVLLHDVVLQLRPQVLLLLLNGAGLPAVLLIQLPSDPKSSSTSPGSPVRVHVVPQDGGLDQLRGGVGCRLAPWAHEAAFLQVGTVEGLHLIDLVGQVYVSVES